MAQIEKIRTEIERLINDHTDGKHVAEADIVATQRTAFQKILSFIDSMQEEPESEDSDEAAHEYVSTVRDLANSMAYPQFNCYDAEMFFIRGANWQKQQIMKDAKKATVIMTHITNESLSPALSVVILPDTFHEGDKVEVIIVKEEKP